MGNRDLATQWRWMRPTQTLQRKGSYLTPWKGHKGNCKPGREEGMIFILLLKDRAGKEKEFFFFRLFFFRFSIPLTQLLLQPPVLQLAWTVRLLWSSDGTRDSSIQSVTPDPPEDQKHTVPLPAGRKRLGKLSVCTAVARPEPPGPSTMWDEQHHPQNS